MGTEFKILNSTNISSTEAYVSTSESSLQIIEKKYNAQIVTLAIVVISIIAIIMLFSMGIFIDCKHQQKDITRKRRIKMKLPPLPRRKQKDDVKAFASDIYLNDVSDTGFQRDAVV